MVAQEKVEEGRRAARTEDCRERIRLFLLTLMTRRLEVEDAGSFAPRIVWTFRIALLSAGTLIWARCLASA